MMDVIKYKYFFIGPSLLLVVAALVGMGVFGFRQGVDFVGGTLWQIAFEKSGATASAVSELLSSAKVEGVSVRPGETPETFVIRSKEIREEEHQNLKKMLAEKFSGFEELSFSSIGPAIGAELRRKAVTGFFLVLLGISLYVAFAFRKVSYPVNSWKYGFVTLVTLFHDAIIPAGLFSYLGWSVGAELDTNFIVAILVVMGFSVHDTIVVFDRIRENILRSRDKENLPKIINASVNQTLARSINTSLTLVLVLVALYFLGAGSLSYFTLLILVGTVIGTYSSIFVASPLLSLLQRRKS